jgi:hypothetical protein
MKGVNAHVQACPRDHLLQRTDDHVLACRAQEEERNLAVGIELWTTALQPHLDGVTAALADRMRRSL